MYDQCWYAPSDGLRNNQIRVYVQVPKSTPLCWFFSGVLVVCGLVYQIEFSRQEGVCWLICANAERGVR